MKALFKKYFAWLFAGNALTFSPEKSQGKLVFGGRSKAFSTLLINSIACLLAMTLFSLIAIKIRHPLVITVGVLTMLAAFILFSVGLIAMAYQPFWQHRKKIILSPEGIFTKNGVGFSVNTKARRIKQFKVRFQVVNPQVTQMQFWLNGKKRYFVNAFFMSTPQNSHEIFDWFREYALHWELPFYDVKPSEDNSIGVFEFAKQGKNQLDQTTSFTQLKQQALDSQLQVGNQPETVAKYAFSTENDEILVTRRPGFKRRSWIFFLSSFLGGLGLLLLLIFGALPTIDDDPTGIYVFMGCIGFLWVILSLASFNDIRSDFLIRASKHQLYFQKRKNKGITIAQSNIQHLVVRGRISQGRYTNLFGEILVVLKEKPVQEWQLFMIDSGRPEKIDTQLVRDAVYERSTRVARLIAQPLEVEVIWEGFPK